MGIGMDRKNFLKQLGILGVSTSIPAALPSLMSTPITDDLFFDISLAEWSLHRALQNGDLTHLQFPAIAKQEFGISAVEYVNQFFAEKANDKAYLDELNSRCDDLGVD